MFSPEEIEKTRQLLELFGTNKLSELSISEPGGYSIEIISGTLQTYVSTPTVVQQAQASQVMPALGPTVKPAPTQPSSHLKTLNSPMVGIFYEAGAPGDAPFVKVGDAVTVGQTIGLIEAMKVFSEIPAEMAGRIIEVIVASGTLVQQSEPLFRIEPV